RSLQAACPQPIIRTPWRCAFPSPKPPPRARGPAPPSWPAARRPSSPPAIWPATAACSRWPPTSPTSTVATPRARRCSRPAWPCLRVRDEEAMLPRCLEAAAAHVDEIIVVDTGSTDRTMDIAREFGATVIETEWTGDFSAARNVSFDAATSDWIFYLDADEVL